MKSIIFLNFNGLLKFFNIYEWLYDVSWSNSRTDSRTDRLVTNGLQQATKLQIRELPFDNQIF